MFNRRTAVLAAALMACISSTVMAQPSPQVVQNAPKRAKKGLFAGYKLDTPPMLYGYRGAGISMATQQRGARKAKNRAQNKRNHR